MVSGSQGVEETSYLVKTVREEPCGAAPPPGDVVAQTSKGLPMILMGKWDA